MNKKHEQELMGPVDLLILQGSPFCNIDCRYCYLPNRLDKSRLAISTIEKTIDRIVEANLFDKDHVSVVWHAGEPMALPLTYYEEAFDALRRKIPEHITIHYNIQTNGMLITHEWCEFFLKHKVRLGVSLDGPADLNDANRLTRSGKGTHAEVMKGVSLLHEHKVPFHSIGVITDKALDRADDIFYFFKELGVYLLGLNTEETEGPNTESTLNNFTREKLKQFFKRMYKLQLQHNSPYEIRELKQAKNKILNLPLAMYPLTMRRVQQTQPYRILVVDTKGNFTTFSPEFAGITTEKYGDMNFGNVHETGFVEAYHSEKFQTIYEEILLGMKMCRESCAYFSVCGGGAPSNKYFENGTFATTETNYCRNHIQTPIDAVLEMYEQSLPVAMVN